MSPFLRCQQGLINTKQTLRVSSFCHDPPPEDAHTHTCSSLLSPCTSKTCTYLLAHTSRTRSPFLSPPPRCFPATRPIPY